MTQADEDDMAAMTRQLIDAALDARRQLLPARTACTPERDQVARAYPRLDEFGGPQAPLRPEPAVPQHHVAPVLRAMNPLRILAVVYAVLFAGVTSLNYIPGLTDAQGRTFGLFALDVFDDALHAASGLWAALAAWSSIARHRHLLLRGSVTLYCLDGLLGLATGSGYLDLGIVLHGVLSLPLTTRVLMNLPHIAIGGFAAFTGFVLARRWAPPADAPALTCSAGRCGSSADCSCSR